MEHLDRPQRSLLDLLAEQQAKLRKLPVTHPDRSKIALRIINLDDELSSSANTPTKQLPWCRRPTV
jgi:hypothetical protein